ncbi:AAA family ATPase [Dokdonella sp.]|uniref:AAA family ATPase n=1 Tax=Dokdonella sp. TaxID=2291710 RepID=UPI001B2D138E|nr:AAA family ATPase [Dokdonella sp.]MBO9664953.1 AAA family ATPase [Dokdonella sp.]
MIDISLAEEFLRTLDPSTDRFEFRTFSDREDGPGSKATAFKFSGTLREHANQLAQLNRAGAGVFVVVNSGGQKAAEIDRVRAVFVDLDGAPIEPVLGAKLPPHIVVETSPQRFHAYWRVTGLAVHEFSGVQRELAALFGGDASVCDLPRVMRLPGFIHQKADPWFVRTVVSEGGESYPANYFRRHAELDGQQFAISGVRWISDDTEADLRSALTAINSDDYSTWVKIGLHLKELGSRGQALWLEWSSKSEKFNESEALEKWTRLGTSKTSYEAVFADAQAKGWKNPKAAGTQRNLDPKIADRRIIRFTRYGELDPRPISWVIKGWLAKDAITALVAQPGVGKTFLALDWAASVAAGVEWHGCRVEQGSVFYLAGEGNFGLTNRLRAWELEHDVSLRDASLFLSDCLPGLCDESAVRTVVAEVRSLVEMYGMPELIVVDTLARAFGGENENDTAAMNRFIAALDVIRHEFACSVVVVHHTGHDPRKTGRGSSAFVGAVDGSVYLEKTPLGIELSSVKEKDWPKPRSQTFSLRQVDLDVQDEDGNKETSAVLIQLPDVLGIDSREKDRYAKQRQKEEVLTLYREGTTTASISERTGIPVSTIQSWINKAGISRSPGKPRGAKGRESPQFPHPPVTGPL